MSYLRYADMFLDKIDAFVRENLNLLTCEELASFYRHVFTQLKEKYFGGSWGFGGI